MKTSSLPIIDLPIFVHRSLRKMQNGSAPILSQSVAQPLGQMRFRIMKRRSRTNIHRTRCMRAAVRRLPPIRNWQRGRLRPIFLLWRGPLIAIPRRFASRSRQLCARPHLLKLGAPKLLQQQGQWVMVLTLARAWQQSRLRSFHQPSSRQKVPQPLRPRWPTPLVRLPQRWLPWRRNRKLVPQPSRPEPLTARGSAFERHESRRIALGAGI
jgi:hypothetical protein